MPNKEKIFLIFEDHTDIIVKGAHLEIMKNTGRSYNHKSPQIRKSRVYTQTLYRTGINISTLYLFLIIFFSFLGCEKNIPVPQHLIGEWKTSSPQYADRYLKIAEHSLIFGIGDGKELSQGIEKVNVKQKNGETIYTMHYKDMEGERLSLTLIYSTVSGGTIKLKNSNVIWEKAKSKSPA